MIEILNPEQTEQRGPNAELLYRTLQYIKDHPDEWDQSDWRSIYANPGTPPVGCFALHTCLLAGGEFVDEDQWGRDSSTTCFFKFVPELDGPHSQIPDSTLPLEWSDEHGVHPSGRARAVLGLTVDQGNFLFYGQNSIELFEYKIQTILNHPEVDDSIELSRLQRGESEDS